MLDQAATDIPVIVALPTAIDLNNADRVYDQLIAALASDVSVVIADLEGTTFCDSAGIRSLVLAQQQAAACHAYLRLAVPPSGSVRRVLELTGLERVLLVYPSLDAAAATA